MDFRTPLKLFAVNRIKQWPSHTEYKSYYDRLLSVASNDYCPEIAFAICMQPYSHLIPVNPPADFQLTPKDQAIALSKAWSDAELKKQVAVGIKKLTERKKQQQEMLALQARFDKAWRNEAEQERLIKEGVHEKLKGWTPDATLEHKMLPTWIIFTTSLMIQIGQDILNESPKEAKQVINDMGQLMVNCSTIDTFGGDVGLISKFLGSLQHATAGNKGPMTLNEVRSLRGPQASAIVKSMLQQNPNFLQDMGRLVGNPERRESIFNLFCIPPEILQKIEKFEAAKKRGEDITDLVMEEIKSDTEGMYGGMVDNQELNTFVQAFEEKKRKESKKEPLPAAAPAPTVTAAPSPAPTLTAAAPAPALATSATLPMLPKSEPEMPAVATEPAAAAKPQVSHEDIWKLPPK